MKAVGCGLVKLPEEANDGLTLTDAAHIIPESTSHGIDRRTAKVCQTS